MSTRATQRGPQTTELSGGLSHIIVHPLPESRLMLSRVLAVAASVLGVGALVLGPSLPAAAATTYVNVGTGGDVNYLPSTQVDAYAGLSDNARLNAMAQDAYASMKSQTQADAIVRYTGGNGITTTTSPGTIAQIETVSGVYDDALPEIEGHATSVRGGAALSVLGKAGEAVGVYYLGTSLVNGVGKIIGVDPEGIVCENTGTDVIGSLVRIVDGASCPANDFSPEFKPNTDASGGLSLSVCYSDGVCTMLAGSITEQANGAPSYYRESACFTIQANGQSGHGFQLIYRGVGGDERNMLLWNGGNAPTVSTPCKTGQVPAAGAIGDNGIEGNYVQGQDKAKAAYADWQNRWCGVVTIAQYNAAGGPSCSAIPQDQQATPLQSNPTRTMKCVTVGTDGVTYTGAPVDYTETDTVLPTPQCKDLPAGVLPQSTSITSTKDGDTSTLGKWDTDSKVLDWAKTYPACTVQSLCSLSLQTKTAKGWSTCKDGDTICGDWFTNPTKDDTYRCVYGIPGSQSTVNLSECDIYQNRFTPEAQKTGDTLTDPKTGKPLTNPKPTNNPSTDAAISNRPASDGDTRSNCFPSGWGAANPVNWVMQPVTCAMENLFVPKASTLPKAQLALRSSVNNSAFGTIKTNVGALGVVGFGSGCSGIPVEWDIFGNHFELYLLRACAGDPLHAVAAAVHTILSGLIVTLALLSILRYLAIIFGFQGLGTRIERAREDSRSGEGNAS